MGYFQGWLRVLLTFVLPVAFATTFPPQALLGEFDPHLLLVGFGLAATALLASNRFWNYAVRHYSSASS